MRRFFLGLFVMAIGLTSFLGLNLPAQAAADPFPRGIDIRHSQSSERADLLVWRHGENDCNDSLEHATFLKRGKSTGDFWSMPKASGIYVPPGFKAKVTNNSGVTTWINESGCRTLRYDSSPKIVRLYANAAQAAGGLVPTTLTTYPNGIDIRHSIYSDDDDITVCQVGPESCPDSNLGLVDAGGSSGDFWNGSEKRADGFYLNPAFKATVTNPSGQVTWVNESGWRVLAKDSSPKIVRLYWRV